MEGGGGRQRWIGRRRREAALDLEEEAGDGARWGGGGGRWRWMGGIGARLGGDGRRWCCARVWMESFQIWRLCICLAPPKIRSAGFVFTSRF